MFCSCLSALKRPPLRRCDFVAWAVRQGAVSLISRLQISWMPILSNEELFPVTDFPTRQLHREFMRYHIHGIVSDKGRKLLKTMLDSLDPKGEIY